MSNTVNAAPSERDLRQRDLIPPERLAQANAVVVGVGAVGRQVALQLAATGLTHMTLIDHDTIEEKNLGPQGFNEKDVGRPKVDATTDECQLRNPQMTIEPYWERFRISAVSGYLRASADNVVFCCVDSIDARKRIFDAVKTQAPLYIDSRMHAEVVQIYTVLPDHLEQAAYDQTLFPEAEAFVGACTGRSTIYTASVAAGLMLSQFVKYLRGGFINRQVELNLASMEMVSAHPIPCVPAAAAA